ncbi:hypothetical protein CW751_00870 [Brumimicrobium salinarum]|uniref:Outer membrane protein beta-barrel domain-containing protein n=1 Tax=Brumimicrobium salinarum TaxID=2058658 RepID=A0A2I0R6D5_9FLAO|nr:hypothetical protein [Brumimicrobium salinarum]PKR81920.1 hypothetical protein CW751_00870 [Brumimicrobium salinarum]
MKFILIFIFCCFNLILTAQLSLDAETGVLFSGYNDVRIAGDQGTLFSLTEELETKPQPFVRLSATYTIADRHNISLLYAPLTINSTGSLDREVQFNGEVFAANIPLESEFRFNSYRLTYRYDIVKNPKWIVGIGFTAKIRDANIGLKSTDKSTVKNNVGFVPIINFRVGYKPTEKFGILLDGDALAAPQGRAEDVLLAVTYDLSKKLELRAGYRVLEGGADNDEVYTFSLFHYAALGANYTFGKYQ